MIYNFIFITIITSLIQTIKFKYILNIKIVSYIDEIIVVILAILAILKVLRRKKIEKINMKLSIGIILFSIIGIVSCIKNSESNINLILLSNFAAVKFWITLISISILFENKDKEKVWKKICKAIFIIEKIAIIFAIFNLFFRDVYLSLFTLQENYIRFGFTSITSIFNHPATYGWFMILCALIRLLDQKEKSNKNKIMIIIDLIFSILSLRTKIILNIIICFLFYILFIQNNNFSKKVYKLLILLFGSLIIFTIFSDIIINTFNIYLLKPSNNSARNALGNTSILIVKDYFPIGVGFGKFGTWFSKVNYSEYYYKYYLSNIYGLSKTHSEYICDTCWPAILGETGFLGVIIYIYMIYIVIKKLYKNQKQEKKYSAVALFIEFILESISISVFTTNPQFYIIAIILGISLSSEKNINENKY